MLVIYILWAVLAAFSIAVGLEPSSQWRKVVNFGNVDPLRRLGLVGGAVTSFFVIFLSFFYMVTSNAAVVFVAWFIVFAVTRLIIEVMGRSNTYLVKDDVEEVQAPMPAKQGILGKDFSKHDLSAASTDLMDPLAPPSAPIDVADVAKEEVSAPTADEQVAEDTSDLPQPIGAPEPKLRPKPDSKPHTAAHAGEHGAAGIGKPAPEKRTESKRVQEGTSSMVDQKPQILEVGPPPGSDEKQAAEYNDLFKRLNSDGPK